ncbi:hypothetical protein IGJ83_003204 [Enterococcus pernyi]
MGELLWKVNPKEVVKNNHIFDELPKQSKKEILVLVEEYFNVSKSIKKKFLILIKKILRKL